MTSQFLKHSLLIYLPYERPYEKASGAHININKFKIMAMGMWDTKINIFNLAYNIDMKILAIHFTGTTEWTTELNWTIMTGQIKSQAKET
jgi:hypothetical protein